MQDKVLILDANTRSALAATRSLGSKSIPVVVADVSTKTLSGASKYCADSFTYPSPYHDSKYFVEVLRKEVERRQISILLPMTEITTDLVLRHRVEFCGIQIPFASLEAFELLSDKYRLLELAQRLKIPIPETSFVRDRGELDETMEQTAFPRVLKPYRSRIFSKGRWFSTSVVYVDSTEQLRKTVACNESFHDHPFLMQEYVQGEGYGIFALYNHGQSIVFFGHKRLREKPPSGGVSVLCESIPLDSRMLQLAKRLLDHVKWHGVAMVEFRVSTDGTPYLMEVNARFWGSLQLAVDAGVDFPYLLYRLALGKAVNRIDNYTTGVKSRWLLGDLDHLYLVIKGASLAPGHRSSKWLTILRFLKLFAKDTRYEVNRWDDPKPFLFELKSYIATHSGPSFE